MEVDSTHLSWAVGTRSHVSRSLPSLSACTWLGRLGPPGRARPRLAPPRATGVSRATGPKWPASHSASLKSLPPSRVLCFGCPYPQVSEAYSAVGGVTGFMGSSAQLQLRRESRRSRAASRGC